MRLRMGAEGMETGPCSYAYSLSYDQYEARRPPPDRGDHLPIRLALLFIRMVGLPRCSLLGSAGTGGCGMTRRRPSRPPEPSSALLRSCS